MSLTEFYVHIYNQGYGFSQFPLCDHFCSRCLLVTGEIVAGPIGAPDTLDPAVRCLHLRVPTVARVVGHLVTEMLSEAELALVDTNFHEEEEDSAHEVGQGLVGYHTLNTEN